MHKPPTQIQPHTNSPAGRRGPSHRLGPTQTSCCLPLDSCPAHSHTGTSPLTHTLGPPHSHTPGPPHSHAPRPPHSHTGTSPLTHPDLTTHTHPDVPTHTLGPPHSHNPGPPHSHTLGPPHSHSRISSLTHRVSTAPFPACPSSRPLPGTVPPLHSLPSHRGFTHRCPSFCQPHGKSQASSGRAVRGT